MSKNKVVRIYTDGACSGNPGPGGWATVWCDGDNIIDRRGGEPLTTNNRMELLAVLEALKWISSENKSVAYEVYSDSAYVINAITKCWLQGWRMRGWKTSSGDEIKNIEVWKQLYNLLVKVQSTHKVTFYKVKGHNGDPMNEYADKIARSEVVRQQYACRRIQDA